jgi:hypothetical protein
MAVISLKLSDALDAQLAEQAQRRQLSKSESLRRALNAFLQAAPELGASSAPSAFDLVAETCFLLSRSGFNPALALQFIGRGVVQLSVVLQEQITAVRTLFRRYDNVPLCWPMQP